MNTNRLHTRSTTSLTAIALGLVMLSGCATPGPSEAEGGGDTIVVATPAPDSLFTFNEVVANELGFYEDEGISVERVALSDSIPVAGLVQNGNADVGMISASDALAAASKTEELALPYDERTGGSGFIFGIVVPEDSGITDLSQLKGESIGLASPDQDLALLASALKEVGLSIDDVDPIMVGPGGSSVAESLSSGRIAAYTGTIADFAAFGDAGLDVVNIIPEGLEGLPVGGYVVRAADLESNEDLIGFFRALSKGTFVALERPEIAAIVTQKVAPEQWREPEVAEFLLEGLAETLSPYDGINFGEIKVERWANAQDLLIETGSLAGPVDLQAFLRTDLLAQINDWDRDEALAQADAWLAQNKE